MNSYYQEAPTYTTYDAGLSTAAILGIILATLLISLAMYALFSYFTSLIFKKAGVKQWKAWVPIYNSYVLLQIGGQPGWWAFLAFIPVVNIASVVFMYIAMYNVGLKLQKSGAFLLLALFLSPVWIIILAFDSSRWNDSAGTPRLDYTDANAAATTPSANVQPPQDTPTQL